MWKRTILALLIVAVLAIQLNVMADPTEVRTFTRTNDELKIESITLDGLVVDNKYAKGPHEINVTFNNTGSTVITGLKFNCSIYNLSSYVTGKIDEPIPDIPAGGLVWVVMDFWNPQQYGSYAINISVNLTAPYGNISKNESFEIQDVQDLVPELLYPDMDIHRVCNTSINQTITCKAKVWNLGNSPATDFNVDLEVYDGTTKVFNTTKVYASTLFPAQSNITVTFADWFNHSYGHLQFKVIADLVGDLDPTNDEASATYWVNYTYYEASEDSGNVEGLVLEMGTNQTLEGVLVSINKAAYNQTTLTDANGSYMLSGLLVADNTFELIFALDGYYDNNATVTVVNNTTTQVANVTMEKIPLCNVNGYVMDEDGIPLAGVLVEIAGLNDTSNATGYYEMLNISTGTYPVAATLPGYKHYPMEVALLPGQTTEFNITMVEDVNVTVTITPANGATGVSPDEPVTVKFNVKFDPITVTSGSVMLFNVDNNNSLVPSTLTSVDDMEITLTPTENMKFGFVYKAVVTTGVRNAFNVSLLSANATSMFTIEQPRVLSSSPAWNTTNVSVETREFWVVYNTELDIADPMNVSVAAFVIRAKNEDPIPGSCEYIALEKKLLFTSDVDLESDTTYGVLVGSGLKSIDGKPVQLYSHDIKTVTVPTTGTLTGTVRDADGNPLANATVTIEGTTFSAITDATGFFEITGVTPGEYTVLISLDGYVDMQYDNVTITAGGTEALPPTTMVSDDGGDGDDDESFLSKYWWIFLIIAVIVVIIIIVIVVVMMRQKPAEEEEEDGRRRYGGAPERRERAAAGGSVSSAREDRGEFVGEEEGSECPNCGEVVSDADAECPNCGVEFEEDAFECPVCGANIGFEATECSDCGAVFAEEEEESEEEEDAYDEEEEPDYEVEVEDEDGVTRFNPKEEGEEEEFGEEGYSEDEEYD